MWNDPIVDEVRKVRRELTEQAGCSIARLLEQDRLIYAQWQGRKREPAPSKRRPTGRDPQEPGPA